MADHCECHTGHATSSLGVRDGDSGLRGGNTTTLVVSDASKSGLESGVVELLGTAELREVEVHDEDGLDGEVPGDIVEDEAESKALGQVEETKDDPVGKVLDVIGVSGGLDRAEGEVGGEEEADEVGNGHGESVDGVEEEDHGGTTEHEVRLGHIGALLSLGEHGVLGELLVELVHVVVGLVLSGQEGGVRLHLGLSRLGS
jgi:hypothetical protein